MNNSANMLVFRLAQENFKDMKILEPELTFAETYKRLLIFYDKLGSDGVRKNEAWLDKNVRSISKSKDQRQHAAKVIGLPTRSAK